MLKLIVEKGPREGETHEFPPNSVVKIGRVVRGNTLAFKDAGISSKHLLIEFKSPKWLISDLDSSNGTILNRSKLPPLCPTELGDGDVVKFGELTSIQVQIESVGGDTRSRRNPRRRAGKEDGSELKTGLDPVIEEGYDLGKNDEVAVVGEKPPKGRGRPKKARVASEGQVEMEVVKKLEIEVQLAITRKTRSSAKAGSSNLEPNVSSQIVDRPKRGRPTRKQPLPEVAENAVSEDAGDNAGLPPSVCENSGENAVQSKQADGHPEMEVSGQGGNRPKRGGGRRKKPLPDVAENVAAEDAGDNAGPPPVCINAGENVLQSEQGEGVGASDLNEDDAGRSNLGQEEHQHRDFKVKNLGIAPPTLPKQGRQRSTRRTSSSFINAECSNLEGNGYPEIEDASHVGSGAKRKKPSTEVVDNNVVSEDVGVNAEVPPPHVFENARENMVQNEPREARDTDKEDVGGSNVDFEQEPDLEKMTLGDWFDYLEVYLPKLIIKETEEIIANMKQKADQVYEYKLNHKNDKGKGKSAMV